MSAVTDLSETLAADALLILRDFQSFSPDRKLEVLTKCRQVLETVRPSESIVHHRYEGCPVDLDGAMSGLQQAAAQTGDAAAGLRADRGGCCVRDPAKPRPSTLKDGQ